MRKTSAGVVQYSGPRGVTGRMNAASCGTSQQSNLADDGSLRNALHPLRGKAMGVTRRRGLSELRPTFGLVQFSFGNTAPPYFLIASLIPSLSRGRRYTGASDPDSDDSDSDSESSSEPDSSETDVDLARRKTGRPRRSKGGSLSSSAWAAGCAGCAGARDGSVVRCGLRGMDEPVQDESGGLVMAISEVKLGFWCSSTHSSLPCGMKMESALSHYARNQHRQTHTMSHVLWSWDQLFHSAHRD
jgi:hypothetical protein